MSRDQPPSCVNWPVAAGLHLGSSAASGDDWDATLVFTSQEEAGRLLREIPKINTVAKLQETHQKHFQKLHIFSAAYFLQWWTEVWKISHFLNHCWPTRCCWMEEKNKCLSSHRAIIPLNCFNMNQFMNQCVVYPNKMYISAFVWEGCS